MKSPRKLLHAPRADSWPKTLLATLVSLLVLLPAWFGVANWYQANLVRQARAKAAEQVAVHANALTSAVNQRIALLQGLYAFTRTEWPDTQFDQRFEIYSSGIYFNSTGVRTLMIAPEGIARYIFPIYDAQVLSGYDLLNDPDPAVRADIQRAIHTRALTLSQPGELRQGGFGLTAWRAVYRGKDLWGLVSIALDMNTVLDDSGLNQPAGGLDWVLRDSSGHTFFGSDTVWQQDPVIQKISMPEGIWELGGAPRGGWNAAVGSQVDLFGLSSLIIVGFVVAMIYRSVNRQGQLEQAVALRTRQIATAQQELEQRIQVRTRELSTLIRVSRRIGSTLAFDPLLGQILTDIKGVLDYSLANIFRLGDNGHWILVSQTGSLPVEGPMAYTDGSFPLFHESVIQQVMTSLQPVIECAWSANRDQANPMCWMGIPLVVKDHAIGVLIMIHQNPNRYHAEDANLALAFAQQIAVAMENARLYEQAGRLAVLEERQRLARELHDSVSQVLYSIGLGARTALAALECNPAQIAEALAYVNRLAEAGQVEMRALIFELRPESLQTDGLVAALEKQAAVLRSRHQMTVHTSLCQEPPVPLVVKEALYRISQEAIHNIIKHASATQVGLFLAYTEKEICLEVNDNGVGFDPSADFPGHLGLRSMRERAVQTNGLVRINSTPGNGSNVRVVIPLFEKRD